MKLATLKDGTRDGRLVVVSRDLTRSLDAGPVARTLQAAIEDWDRAAPRLADLYAELDAGAARHAAPFDPRLCHSPLPRAYQWADGSAYVNHVELVRRARGAEMPQSFWTDPLMYQGGSDSFIGPCDDAPFADEAWGIDFEGEVAVTFRPALHAIQEIARVRCGVAAAPALHLLRFDPPPRLPVPAFEIAVVRPSSGEFVLLDVIGDDLIPATVQVKGTERTPQFHFAPR